MLFFIFVLKHPDVGFHYQVPVKSCVQCHITETLQKCKGGFYVQLQNKTWCRGKISPEGAEVQLGWRDFIYDLTGQGQDNVTCQLSLHCFYMCLSRDQIDLFSLLKSYNFVTVDNRLEHHQIFSCLKGKTYFGLGWILLLLKRLVLCHYNITGIFELEYFFNKAR